MNENDFIEVGIIEEWVNQIIKVGQFASFYSITYVFVLLVSQL